MPIPFHNPCISEDDFEVPLPVPLDEEELVSWETSQLPDTAYPVYYHIALAKIATVYYRFRKTLQTQTDETINIVRTADKQLADIISGLPTHLQPDEPRTRWTDIRDTERPWISWQKWDLTLVLLYYRLAINRTLQREWHVSPEKLSGQRAICLDSARSILWISRNWDYPVAQRKQWYDFFEEFNIIQSLYEQGIVYTGIFGRDHPRFGVAEKR
jgi:hypothetical protein